MSDTPPPRPALEERRLAAIMFTDVVGYSARMQRDETGTLALVRADFEHMGALCAQHGGEILNTMGDGMLLCFPSAVQAVGCALQIQLEFGRRRETLPPEQALEHRIGIHLGDIIRQAGGVAGDGVNIAARLQTKAPPGGICISQTVNDTVKGKIAMQSVFLGPQSFKNIREPIPIYHLAAEGAPAPASPVVLSPDRPTRARWRRRLLLTGAIGALVGLLAAAGFYAWWQRPKKLRGSAALAVDTVRDGRVLVAEFEDRTGDAAEARLGQMLADRVRQGATQVSWVLSAGAGQPPPAKFTETAAAIKKLGGQNGADVLVSGAYYRQGDKLLLEGRIFDLRRGLVFADLAPVTGSAADPTAATEEFVQRLLGAIDTLGLTRSANPVPVEKIYRLNVPPRLDAREAMRAGLEIDPPAEVRLAHLKRSYALDPQGCLGALVWQAVVLIDTGRYAEAAAVLKESESFPERLTPYFRAARDWARAALAGDAAGVLEAAATARAISQGSFVWIDKTARELLYTNRPKKFLELMTVPAPAQAFVDRVPETWLGRASAYCLLGQHEREAEAARQAQELDPENPLPLALAARAQAALGHVAEADAAIEASQGLTPTAEAYPGFVMLAALAEYRLTGQQAPAEALQARTLAWYAGRTEREMAQEDWRWDYARACALAGKWDQARELAAALAKEHPDRIAYRGFVGTCEARLGHRDQAERILGELRALDPQYRFGEPLYFQARIAAVLGRTEDALQWLREAMAQRSVPVSGFSFDYLRVEPDFASLRDLPAYKAILAPRE
jgi:class 3 adenylate cyclase/tetratricopeptide (TPR) repeat protein